MLPNYTPRTPPFKHQYEALVQGWRRPGYGYLLEMGLGKTRVLIDNFCLLHQAGEVDGLLVIAPKGVYGNWSRVDDENPGELQSWLWDGIRETTLTYTWRSGKSNTPRERAAQAALLATNTPGARVLVVNAEALSVETTGALDLCRRFLRAHKSLIVVDESTLMQDPKSNRTKRITSLRDIAKYRRILTGSPTKGLPTDLFAQFDFLQVAALGHRSWYTFRAAYCVLQDIVIGGRTIKKVTGTRNTEDLARRVAANSYRRRKSECLDLPDKIYRRREVELTPEQNRVYKELRQTAMAGLDGGETVTTQIVVTQLMRLHQVLCGHVKTDDGRTLRLQSNRLGVLEELLADSDESTIIWCNYKSDLHLVANRLKELYGEDAVAEWHGDIPQQVREAGETEFQNRRARFMVASQQAGGRGRTWTAATLVVYYSNNHDLELREQSEDRAHRIGQTKAVTYVDLVCPGTLDERIIKALRSKKSVVREILQDGPGEWM